MENHKQFIQGALLLSASGIIVKVLGALYRIPLYNILGSEGMGLFQAAYPIYEMLYFISIAGLPIAISKLVADKVALNNYAGARQIFHVSLVFMAIISFVITTALVLSAQHYAENILQTPDVYYPLIAAAPSLLFVGTISAYRGFFQGQQIMKPTAVAQIIQQLIRVSTIIVLSLLLVNRGIKWGAAGAAFGTVTGVVASLAYLSIKYKRHKKHFERLVVTGKNVLSSSTKVLKDLFVLSLPITISSVAIPLMNLADSTIILPQLQVAGFSQSRALEMFGNFTGAALPLVLLPTVITVALATNLIPAVARAQAGLQKKSVIKYANLAIKLGAMIGAPAAIGLMALSSPISIALYGNPEISQLIVFSAGITFFVTILQTTTATLQGIGLTYIPVRNAFIGLAVKIVLNYTLAAIPGVNIFGPIIGTMAYFGLASMLNIWALKQYLGTDVKVAANVSKPLLNSVIMGACVLLLYISTTTVMANMSESQRVSAVLVLALAMPFGVFVYGASSLLTGSVTAREIALIPGVGIRLRDLLFKIGLIRNNSTREYNNTPR